MRKMKKLAGLLLALVMVLSMGVTAMADDPTYTITITYEAIGHTYEAYQIFTGDLDSTGTVLSNVVWGSGIVSDASDNSAVLLAALKANTTVTNTLKTDSSEYYNVGELFSSCTTAADVAKVLADYNSDTELAETFAEIASNYILSGTGVVSDSGTYNSTSKVYEYKITGLAAGYYLVKDEDNGVTAAGDSYTDIILQVVTNVTVAAKADTVELDKTITGTTTDQSKDGTNREDDTTADYTVGDNVRFTLTAKLPSNYDDYDTYKLTFHDTLSFGLTFNNDVKVTVYTAQTGLTAWNDSVDYYTFTSAAKGFEEVDTTSVTAPASGVTYYTKCVVSTGYDVATSTQGTRSDTTCTFEVQIADTNKLYEENSTVAATVTNSSIITVEYTAKLESSAKITETNSAKLEYSNNPNDDGSETGTTTEDKTTVFTFTLDVDKVDEDGNPLETAKFTLYKVVTGITEFETGKNYYTYNSTTKAYEAVDTSINTTPVSGTTYYVAVYTSKTGETQYSEVTITEFASGETYYTYNSTSRQYEQVNDTSGTPDSATKYFVNKANGYTFAGLGVGTYVLVESSVPDGYNKMDDLTFKIEAETIEKGDGTCEVQSLKIVDANGGNITDFKADASAQTIDTDIKNQAGSTLPSTGGIGTTIFYIVGTIMVLGAAVVLITRRRMRSAE